MWCFNFRLRAFRQAQRPKAPEPVEGPNLREKTMKRIVIIALFALITLPVLAQSNDKKPGINKENCTFTTKDGKTFNLYGKVKIVEHFPDIKVQLVDSFEDLDVKLVESFPDQCGKIKLVESFPDVKVQIVEHFPDIKVKIVESFPGVKK